MGLRKTVDVSPFFPILEKACDGTFVFLDPGEAAEREFVSSLRTEEEGTIL